ncbi:hypothetical protein [Pseudomonas sp. nanlin1]|uniref:hypothetical protein n=1 Tax=Pseudomonas sp. nanlin1 TaxID=3040605 RepID=UPI00388DE016
MLDIRGKSFIASLECEIFEDYRPVVYDNNDRTAGGGWLVWDFPAGHTLELRFDYLEHTCDRIHYRVSGAPSAGYYAGAKIGASLNGFLGLYNIASVTDFWKVEVLSSDEQANSFDFYWRDSQGKRVCVYHYLRTSSFSSPSPASLNFLTTLQGTVGIFRATIKAFV